MNRNICPKHVTFWKYLVGPISKTLVDFGNVYSTLKKLGHVRLKTLRTVLENERTGETTNGRGLWVQETKIPSFNGKGENQSRRWSVVFIESGDSQGIQSSLSIVGEPFVRFIGLKVCVQGENRENRLTLWSLTYRRLMWLSTDDVVQREN